MFKSELTGKLIGPNVPQVTFVTHKRKRIYTAKDKYGNDHVVATGSEIVKQIAIAPNELELAKAEFGEEGTFVD